MSEETVNVRCPNLLCRAILAVPAELRGQRVRCGSCTEILVVPAKKSTAKAAAPGREEARKTAS